MRMIITVLILSAALCVSAFSHPRDYLVTTPYWTSPKGAFEVELRTNYAASDSDHAGKFVHQTEVEYGLTDRLTVGVYGVWEKPQGSSLGYKETKFEAKHRLAEPGRLYFNPAIYGEYIWASGSGSDEFEGKLILQRYISERTNIAINGIIEHEMGSDDWESGYTLGIACQVWPKTKLGLELKGKPGDLYIIPGAYLDFAPNKRLNIGPSIGLTGKSTNLEIKTLLELEF